MNQDCLTPQGQLQGQEIAIIGISLRFPESGSLSEFWSHLIQKRSLIRELPTDRRDPGSCSGDESNENDNSHPIWGGFIENADCFDAPFFKVSPREAQLMDPQQRMAMELAWQAIEDTGYRASALKSSNTGVFMGICNADYAELIERDLPEVDAYIPTGTGYSILSNRISYFFDFKGPSIAIDAACASSLVAIHQAVVALRSGECDLALAGGVNLCLSSKRFAAFRQCGMLSPDGQCKAFDEGANGYVRGEGGAILVLKPFHRAVQDGDRIYALLKGTGANHGGRTNALTVTNPKAQAELISYIYSKACIHPETVNYIEAHGPGTPLGDPIEILGLKTAFRQLFDEFKVTPQRAYCGIGSVKTHIGHLEAAAGVAGVIKVVAALKHGFLPPTLHFQRLNPVIHLEDSPFYIVQDLQPWERIHDAEGTPLPRRAGVSAFGFGGV